MLFRLRYRKRVAGVTETLIEASSLEQAERVGQAWVKRDEPAGKYISVERAVAADESILGEVSLEPAPGPNLRERPTPAEQQKRQEQKTAEAAAQGNVAPALRPDADSGDAASGSSSSGEAAKPEPVSARGRAGRIGQ